MRKLIWAVLAVMLLSGCTTGSGNMYIGTEMPGSGFSDQRAAIQHISVFDQLPESYAGFWSPIDTGRCHRNAFDESSTDEIVIADLQMAV